ncbi:hypothetical protein PFISCL1PPCAC_13550, partial [Pristionchus fissidentatus]
GMDVCRACSHFFKRAIISRKGDSYKCRSRTNSCPIYNGRNLSCRGCRYAKCVSVGMVYDGPLRINKPTQMETRNIELPTTSAASFLDSVGAAYRDSIDRRRDQERILLLSRGDFTRIPHPTQELYSASHDTALATFDITMSEAHTFFLEVFPTLLDLPQAEQNELFQLYTLKFSVIDGYYRTIKTWGNANDYVNCSALICANLSSIDKWISKSAGGSQRAALLGSVRDYTKQQLELIVPPLQKADITDTELNALLTLILCDIDSPSCASDSVISRLENIQLQVLDELQQYYRRDWPNTSDCSIRLCNLLMLRHGVRESASLYYEFFRIRFALFDVFETELAFKDLIL